VAGHVALRRRADRAGASRSSEIQVDGRFARRGRILSPVCFISSTAASLGATPTDNLGRYSSSLTRLWTDEPTPTFCRGVELGGRKGIRGRARANGARLL